jgi:hypothetical protein
LLRATLPPYFGAPAAEFCSLLLLLLLLLARFATAQVKTTMAS